MNKHKNSFRWELFDKVPVVGILREVSTEDADMILPVFIDTGFTTIEIPINSDNSASLISRLVQHFGDRLNIGAGTVTDMQDLHKALDAGAGFIVTPVVAEEVIQYCERERIPVFPGAFTPTEIVKAWKLGASMVKVFPADELGPGYIKALKAPLKNIKLLPTGGISIDNAREYFVAGAAGLGISTGLFKAELIRNKDWTKLRDHLFHFYQTIQHRPGQ